MTSSIPAIKLILALRNCVFQAQRLYGIEMYSVVVNHVLDKGSESSSGVLESYVSILPD
jgi:hypothetical protein